VSSKPEHEFSTLREEIDRKARAHAEAQTYSLVNPYLTEYQKAVVEGWHQTPIGVFYLVALMVLAWRLDFNLAFYSATVFSLLVALIFLRVTLPKLHLTLGTIFAGWIAISWCLGFAIFFAWKQLWWYAVFAVGCSTGLLAFLASGFWVHVFSSRVLHFKYAFAKRAFGIDYPFEPEL
jgi:hypothetical protein